MPFHPAASRSQVSAADGEFDGDADAAERSEEDDDEEEEEDGASADDLAQDRLLRKELARVQVCMVFEHTSLL